MTSMLEPEYTESYNAWKLKQTPETRAALSQALLPTIKHMISATGGDPENPVMLAKSRMVAMQALKGYNPEKAKLNNYMYSHLMGLNRVIGKANNIVQVPEGAVLDKKKLDTAEKELLDSLGRYPSSTELADYTGLSIKRIAKLRETALPIAASQLIDQETGEQFNPSAKIIGDESQQLAWQEYVYDSLDDRKRAIMERLYGMHGFRQQTPKEVANALKISTAAISQQRKKIDEALNSDSQFGVFGNG